MTNPVFKIVDNPTVWWPVTLNVPVDGGVHEQRRIEACIRVLPESTYQEKLEPLAARQRELRDNPAAVLDLSAAHLREYVVDWRGIVDTEGAIPISGLPDLIRGPYGRPLTDGLWRAIAEVRFGLPPQHEGATAKNSVPSPAPGQATAAPTN
ncbi:MAG: hypothetical protein LBF61_02795 [Azoarcus sp.]|jgi:hypothetical protein|nr:hypothetical protein [Azoarcus sp.]